MLTDFHIFEKNHILFYPGRRCRWHEVSKFQMEYLSHKSDISGSSHLSDSIRPPAECDEMPYTIAKQAIYALKAV